MKKQTYKIIIFYGGQTLYLQLNQLIKYKRYNTFRYIELLSNNFKI